VPPAGAADAICEAIDAEIPLIVCITEGIPVLDMVRVKRALRGSKSRLVGPNCPGRHDGRRMQDRHHAGQHLQAGSVGIVSRSGHADLRGGVPDDAARGSARPPRSASAATRSRAPSSSTCSSMFLPTRDRVDRDDRRDRRLGRGGRGAVHAREAKQGARSPWSASSPGRTAPPAAAWATPAPSSRRQGRREDKIAAMEAAGIRVSPSPARLGKTLVEVLKGA
jgi:succinyl-CoA synthetase alpha subunit